MNGLGLLTAVQLIAWGMAWAIGASPLPLVVAYVALAFAALGAALAIRFVLTRRGPSASWSAILAATIMLGVGASLFSALKFAIPALVPFWLDAPIDRIERALFGAAPWQILDSDFGWSTIVVDRIYGLWLPTQLIVLFSVIIAAPSAAKSRAMISYAASWLLIGVGGGIMLSSAGPIFFDRVIGGARFAALHSTLVDRHAVMVLTTSDLMWSSYASATIGLVSGISAMPSMHVAISLWIVLAARTLAPRLAPLAWSYFAFIWIASVQLGWHYASDGLAGCIGLAVVWKAVGTFSRRPAGSPPASTVAG